MIFFTVEHAPTGDILRQYIGMPQDTVSMLQAEYGNPFEFIEEADYKARVAAIKLPPGVR